MNKFKELLKKLWVMIKAGASKVWTFTKKMFSIFKIWEKKELSDNPDVIIPTPYMLYGLLAFFVHTVVYSICVKLTIGHAQIFAILISLILFLLKESYDKRVNGDKFRINDFVSAAVGIGFSALHFMVFIG